MAGQAIVSINGNQWSVSIASTYAELTTGLRGVTSLAAGTGILFVLPSAQEVSVDTTGMSFALDIIFISDDTVIEVARNVPPGYLVTEETLCDAFLEVNAGEAISVEPGDSVSTATIQQGMNFSQIMSFAIPLATLGFVCAMAGGMAKLVGSSSSHSSGQRRLGEPKSTSERLETHERKYGTRELPTRGIGQREEVADISARVEEDFAPIMIKEDPTITLRESHLSVVEGKADLLTIGTTGNPTVLDKNIAILHEIGHQEGKPIPREERFLPGFEQEVGAWVWVIDNASRYGITPSQVVEHIKTHIRETDGKRRLLEILEERRPEHHSMWLTREQRKECEAAYGAVACRWGEELAAVGDFETVKRAAEKFYAKMREAVGIA